MVLLEKMTVSSHGNIRLRCAMKLLGCAKIFGVLGCLGYVSAGLCKEVLIQDLLGCVRMC